MWRQIVVGVLTGTLIGIGTAIAAPVWADEACPPDASTAECESAEQSPGVVVPREPEYVCKPDEIVGMRMEFPPEGPIAYRTYCDGHVSTVPMGPRVKPVQVQVEEPFVATTDEPTLAGDTYFPPQDVEETKPEPVVIRPVQENPVTETAAPVPVSITPAGMGSPSRML